MTATPASTHRGNCPGWVACLALVWLSATAALAQSEPVGEAGLVPASGQTGEVTTNSIGRDDHPIEAVPAPSAPSPIVPVKAEVPAPEKPERPSATAPIGGLMQVGCSSCGGGLLGLPPAHQAPGGCGDGTCPERPCPAGRQPCHPCLAQSKLGRCICALYECICCPDPCYEPRWMPIADSAFFVDSARPQTQQRVRWDCGLNLLFPDRSEFFWARADGSGKGPPPVAPAKAPLRIRYDELSLYTEAGTGAAGITFEMPYRAVDPDPGVRAAGFGDMTIGTKALLFDCELLQITMMFKTYMPAGNFRKGLGVGHVSLEPSLVIGLKLACDTYVQGQVAEWIPLGGDSDYQGAILHYHVSLNQVLFRVLPDVPLIGTLELNGWMFQDGAYTDPLLGPFQKSSGEMYVMPAVGIRLFVCDKIDFGFAAAFAVTERHFADQLYRTELRFRF
jgi:hypothetical protein